MDSMQPQENSIRNALSIESFVRNRTVAADHKERRGLLESILAKRKITETEKAEFCTQLAVMLEARVSLHRALEVLSLQTKSERMKLVIEQLLKDVQKGGSFSSSLARQPEVFDRFIVVSAEVGQETGSLGEALWHVAQHIEKINALKRKVRQALTYPFLVITVAFVAVSFLLVFIVPTFAEMFRSFQMELPSSTRLVLSVSEFATQYGLYVPALVMILLLSLRHQLRSPKTKRRLQCLSMSLPFVGSILQKNYIARFCRTLGTMLHSQVSLVEALQTSKGLIENEDFQEEVGEIVKQVKQGQSVARPITESKFFPPMVAQMITVGEETSELDRMLLKVADYYEKEIDSKVETLSNLIEPVIVLFLGLLVGAILIAMYLPMFDLVNVIGQ